MGKWKISNSWQILFFLLFLFFFSIFELEIGGLIYLNKVDLFFL